MKKSSENLQDIYRTPKERTANPDYVWQMPEELEGQLRRHRIRSAILGLFSFVLLLILTALLLREAHVSSPPPLRAAPEEAHYVPHYTLPSDDLWVMSYQQAASGLAIEGGLGDRPVSTKWLKNVAYHLIVGQQALAVKQYEKAAVHFEKALAIFPGIHGVRGSLGTVYLKQQKFEEAVEVLERAVQEEESFSATSNLGAALLAAERFEEAEKYLLRARALNPDHPGCYKNLALLYQKMELSEKALGHFKKYFSLYREDFAAVEIYAEYLLGLGQREQAATFLREACQQERKDALPLYLLLAKIEARATNDVQAVEALKNITRYISPNLALTELHMDDFDTIRDTEAFQALLHQIELAVVTLENQN